MIREGMQTRINQGWVLLQRAQRAIKQFTKFKRIASNPKQPVPCATLIAIYVLCGACLITATACSVQTVADAGTSDNVIPVINTELSADLAKPVISIDEVINPKTSMDGDYPMHSSHGYGGPFFWLDNHRIIYTGLQDNDIKKPSVIKIWDIDNGKVIRYRVGGIMCYLDGIAEVYVRKNPSDKLAVRSVGPLGKEIPGDLTYRRNINPDECRDEPSHFIKEYMDAHPDEVVSPLRREHGLLVVAKREKEGQTFRRVEQDAVVFHSPGKEPLRIPLDDLNDARVEDYFPFAQAYNFWTSQPPPSSEHVPHFYVLAADGAMTKIKIPDEFLKHHGIRFMFLTRRGLLWANSSIATAGPGIYLSRGEMVKKISPDGVDEAKISPDGCHVAYLDVPRNHGKYEGTLKIIDLCKGEQ